MKNPARLQTLAMPLALLGICVFFALRESAFLGPRNLTQLLVEFSITGTLALGMFMILLTGQIDLSVGSGVGLIGGLAAVLATQQAWPAPLTEGLRVDLDVTRGVTLDAQGRVAKWTNQAGPAEVREFVGQDKGRKVPGSGLPAMGEGALVFRAQELLCHDEKG